MANNILFISLAALVAVVSSASLPSYFKKCSVSEASSGCVLQNARTSLSQVFGGIPELNVESFDPLHVGRVYTDLAGLMMDLKDLTVKGFKNANIEEFSIDLKKNKLKLEYITDVIMKSPYVASGRVIVLPISGTGQATIKIKQLKLTTITDIEQYQGTDGKQHIRAKNAKVKFTNGQATFALTNLFDGNKMLSDIMLNFLNTSWKEVSKELGGPSIQAVGQKIVANINQLFAAVPLEDLITGA